MSLYRPILSTIGQRKESEKLKGTKKMERKHELLKDLAHEHELDVMNFENSTVQTREALALCAELFITLSNMEKLDNMDELDFLDMTISDCLDMLQCLPVG